MLYHPETHLVVNYALRNVKSQFATAPAKLTQGKKSKSHCIT